MLYNQYEWSFGVYDEVSRSRGPPLPIPCRPGMNPSRDQDDPDDTEDDHRPRHRSRAQSVWERLFSSRARNREPRSERGFFQATGSGRNRKRIASRGSGDLTVKVRISNLPPRKSVSPSPSSKNLSPCNIRRPHRSKSPRGGASAIPITADASFHPSQFVFIRQDDDVTQGCGDDPMEVQVAINYSPEGDGSRKACPEYTPLATGLDAVQETSIDMVDQLVNSLSTPVRPPILPTPRPIRTKRPKIAIQSSQRHSEGLESKRRNNCKLEMVGQEIISKRFGTTNEGDTFNGNVKKLYLQRFKRPLTPRSLKMIADLVEKGASGRPKQRPSSSRRHPSPRPEDDRCCLGGRLHK